MRTLFTLGISIAVSLSASAADLSIPNQTVPTGTTTVQAELRLDATPTPLTGIQADVVVPPGLGVAAQLGAAASNANKQLSTSDVANGKRLLIVGFNQTPIPAGTIVTLTITLPATASGELSIRLANASGTDATGKTIPLSTTDATIYVRATTGDTMIDRGAFAQVASGGSWKTTFSIVNTSSALNKTGSQPATE